MVKLKIPEFKDPMDAIRWIMLITVLPFILYMFLVDEPGKEVSAKELYEKALNDSYSSRISEKEHDCNRWYKFHISTGRYVYIDKSVYDAAEVGDTLWKKSRYDKLYIKMPDGAVLGFDGVSKYRNEYLEEVKKQVK
jgi:hypothetical protein